MSANRILLILWLVASFALFVMPFFEVDETFRLYYSNAGQVFITLGSAFICFRTMNAFPSDSALNRVWFAIAGGVLSWGVAAAIFASYPIMNGNADTPYPYFSDIFYLLTEVLIITGLLLFMRSAGLVAPLWGKLIAVGTLIVSGYFAYGANAEGLADPGMATNLAALGYFVLDPILVSVALLTASSFRSGNVAVSMWYVVAGVLLFYIGNQMYTYLLSIEHYVTGSPIDAFWLLGFGLIACGAVKARKMIS